MTRFKKLLLLFCLASLTIILSYYLYFFLTSKKSEQILTGQILLGVNIENPTRIYCPDQFYLVSKDRIVWIQERTPQSATEYGDLSSFENLRVKINGKGDSNSTSCFNQDGVWCGCDYLDVDTITSINN
jgi:hypothetical protein